MTELDDIAKETQQLILAAIAGDCGVPVSIIRTAIDKALEVVLTREPTDIMKMAGLDELDIGGKFPASRCYRAMTKQLLEELKGNESVTRAGNHPSVPGG